MGCYNIRRLLCHFKIDDQNRTYFLFATSIRIAEIPGNLQTESPHSTSQPPKQIDIKKGPPRIIDVKSQINIGPRDLNRRFHCTACRQMMVQEKVYEINLKWVINHFLYTRKLDIRKMIDRNWGKSITKLQMRADEMIYIDDDDFESDNKEEAPSWLGTVSQRFKTVHETIPKMILDSFPDLKKDDYKRLMKEESFLRKTLVVCEECFLYITRVDQFSGSKAVERKYYEAMKSEKPIGTGRLRPELTKLRYNTTIHEIFHKKVRDIKERGLKITGMEEDRSLGDANKRHCQRVDKSDSEGDVDESDYLEKADVKKLEYQIKSVIFLLAERNRRFRIG